MGGGERVFQRRLRAAVPVGTPLIRGRTRSHGAVLR